MWRIWLLEHGRWLAAGVGLMVAGSGLARFWWFEFGMALLLLGAAALGCLVGLARSAVLDAALTERIDRQLDELREEQRRAREAEWRSDGVSPIEKSWRALALRAGAAGHASAPAPAPASANDVDRRLADLIRQRCDRVWSGIQEKRYWRHVDGKAVGPDLGAIGKEIEDVVREVARLYHQDRDDPVMEARLGDIVLTGRSVLGEILQIARLVPLVDLPAQSLATVKTRLEQIQQARAFYQQYSRYRYLIDFAAGATRVALGSNPVTAAAWYVGGKALTLAGTHVATKYVHALLRDALESSVALVYEHVARTYDPGRARLSADYAALVFAWCGCRSEPAEPAGRANRSSLRPEWSSRHRRSLGRWRSSKRPTRRGRGGSSFSRIEPSSDIRPRESLRWTMRNPRCMPETGCAFCADKACCRTISSCLAETIA